MGYLNGAGSPAESMDPQTSEHDRGQPAVCYSGAGAATGTLCGLFNAIRIHDCLIRGLGYCMNKGWSNRNFYMMISKTLFREPTWLLKLFELRSRLWFDLPELYPSWQYSDFTTMCFVVHVKWKPRRRIQLVALPQKLQIVPLKKALNSQCERKKILFPRVRKFLPRIAFAGHSVNSFSSCKLLAVHKFCTLACSVSHWSL